MRAETLGVGALLSFRMRRQTTPASPGHHEPRGGAAVAVSCQSSPPPSPLRPFVASIIAGVEGTRFGCVVCPAHFTTVPGHCLARARPSRPTAPVLVGRRGNVKAVLPATAAASAQPHFSMWLTYGCLHSVRPRPRLFLRRPPFDFPPVLLNDEDVRPQPRPRQGAFCRDFVT